VDALPPELQKTVRDDSAEVSKEIVVFARDFWEAQRKVWVDSGRDLKREDEIEPLNRVMNAGRHLLGLINDILDLSKIEAGKMEVHIDEFAVAPLIDDAVKTVETLAAKNNNRLVVDCKPEIGAMQADQTRVKQALLNLLSNANPGPPPALTSAEWAASYNEIKELGGRNSTKRSAQQTKSAHFWLATDGRVHYPVIRTLVADKELSVIDSARLFALIAVARADALIAVFDAKYAYEFWRPVTAIRNGDIDGNAATERDAAWQPIDATPMHPEYPCAHCISSGSLAGVVQAVFGTPEISEVSMTSPTAPDVIHHWTNVRDYSNEVSEARIWAGFHYRFSTKVGQDMGYKIGDYVVKNFMQPVATVTR
jgi:hypothetical protein